MYRERKYFLVTTIAFICLLQLTQAAFLRCYNRTQDNYIETTLEKPLVIWPCLDPNLQTVIYTFGYKGKPTGPATRTVLQAYLLKQKRNVILLDWEAEAQSGGLGFVLGYVLRALPNIKRIGNDLGDALLEFNRHGMQLTQIHLVGHSLGAHLMAIAGKRTRSQGQVVARITGLDPARALCEGSLIMQDGLDRTCAQFVDIIHTDPDGYGSNLSKGTVDIWPNYGISNDGAQPGCPSNNLYFDQFSTEDLCSHDRAWRYFAEALGSPTAFPAAFATDVNDWIANNGKTNMTIYLGDLTNTQARGNFFLLTNAEPPFGKGALGLIPGNEFTKVTNNLARERRHPLLTKIFKYFR